MRPLAWGKREPEGEERRGRERKERGYFTISLRMCVRVREVGLGVAEKPHTHTHTVVFFAPGWTEYYLQPRDYSVTLKARDLTWEQELRTGY